MGSQRPVCREPANLLTDEAGDLGFTFSVGMREEGDGPGAAAVAGGVEITEYIWVSAVELTGQKGWKHRGVQFLP